MWSHAAQQYSPPLNSPSTRAPEPDRQVSLMDKTDVRLDAATSLARTSIAAMRRFEFEFSTDSQAIAGIPSSAFPELTRSQAKRPSEIARSPLLKRLCNDAPLWAAS